MSDTPQERELLTEQFQVICTPAMKAALVEAAKIASADQPAGLARVVRDCIMFALPSVRVAYEGVAAAREALNHPERVT